MHVVLVIELIIVLPRVSHVAVGPSESSSVAGDKLDVLSYTIFFLIGLFL